MLGYDFSQLPVMIGQHAVNVKGVISWASIGARLALGRRCTEVRECMEAPRIISSDTSIFDAIGEIVREQYVLVAALRMLLDVWMRTESAEGSGPRRATRDN